MQQQLFRLMAPTSLVTQQRRIKQRAAHDIKQVVRIHYPATELWFSRDGHSCHSWQNPRHEQSFLIQAGLDLGLLDQFKLVASPAWVRAFSEVMEIDIEDNRIVFLP